MGTNDIFERFGRIVPKGSVIFRENDTGSVMYLIREGKIRIHKIFIDNDTGSKVEKELAVLGNGEFFGEMSLLNQEPRSASATALEDSKVLEINNSIFEQIVQSNGKFAHTIILKLAVRVRDTNNLIKEGLFQSKQQNILSAILSFVQNNTDTIALQLLFKKVHEIKDSNIRIEKLEFTKLLNKLVKADLISFNDKAVKIIDVLKLRQVFNLLIDR